MHRARVAALLPLLLLCAGAPAAQAPVTAPPDARTAPAAPPAKPGAEDAGPVLAAQIRLERAHFSPGEIDGAGGSNTRRAIAAFQRSRGLPDSGELDEATRAALAADTAPVLATYTVTAADVAGPFVRVPDDMMEKGRLPTLGYASALEALAEKFRASPRLLRRLNPGKPLDTAGTELRVPNLAGMAPLPAAASVVVDGSESTLELLDASGKTIAQFPATTGSEHDPLPIGEWTITGVALDPPFHYNPELFWDADPSHAKAKIAPGPNNPVGVAWIDLSKPHYGIHGTPEPATVGKAQSHGCIRVTNWSAREIARAVKPGTPVVLQE